jgi:hypothetical protein
MSKQGFTASIVTANRLVDGTVVFLDDEGTWHDSAKFAAIARSPDEARALEARGAHDAARNLVVEPYLIEVREADDGLVPLRVRERVRFQGPSVLGDVVGYARPRSPAVVRQAHHGVGVRPQHTAPRAEPVEARAPSATSPRAA